MAIELLTRSSSTPRNTDVAVTPLEELDHLNELVRYSPTPESDWHDRLNTIRDNAVSIGLWDEDCEKMTRDIAQRATDRELDQLQKDVMAGRGSDWDDRLLIIRSHARAESVWSPRNEDQATAIAAMGMDSDLRAIDSAPDASTEDLRIDIARAHSRTAGLYGIDRFSDVTEGLQRLQVALQYHQEAFDQLTDAGRALDAGDLPMAGYSVGWSVQSGINAHISFLQGAHLLIMDRDVLPIVSPPFALGKHLMTAVL